MVMGRVVRRCLWVQGGIGGGCLKFKISIFYLLLTPPSPLGVSGDWLSLRGSCVGRGTPQLLPPLCRLPAGVKVRPPVGAALRGGVA